MTKFEDYPVLANTYTKEEWEKLTADYIDTATADALYMHFLFRQPASIDTIAGYNAFEVRLQNALRKYYSQYNEYIRIETTKVDFMVTDYFEHYTENSQEGTSEETSTGTENTTNSGKNTRNITGNSTNHAEGSGTSGNTETTDGRQIQTNLPQSISYSDTSGNTERSSAIPSLNWQYAGAQAENDGKTTNSGSTSDKTDGNEQHTDTETYEAGTAIDKSNNGSKTGKTTGKTTNKERSTGRSGRAPQELLDTARNYILKTNAFDWLCDKLNGLFLWVIG